MPPSTTPSNDSAKTSGTRITVTLPPEHYEHVLRVAKRKRVSASWVVRDAVERYLADEMPLFAENESALR
jgi:Arc/MetJ-type ribon-helix-helix transcriptional regulator